MFYSIDRFEENTAVLLNDNGVPIDVERTVLPADVAQGDIVVLKDGKWVKDLDETAKRRDYILKLQQKLINKTKNKNNR